MSRSDLWGPYHPELRAVRWFPRVAVGPRTLRLWRFSLPARRSTPEVNAASVTLRHGASARLFRPTRVSAGAPAVLWIHGGGLVMGSPTFDEATNISLSRDLGAVVLAPSYRLAPEHPAPAALDDVYAAYLELIARADEWGVDSARIAIAGASAGGGLAAALVQRIHDEGGVQPVFQLLVYPMLDDRTTLRTDQDSPRLRVWTPQANHFGWRSYLAREPGGADVPAGIVPARREDLSGLPPAWIGVGSLDLFHDEDAVYAERLCAAGVSCEFEVVPGAVHGFDGMFPRTDAVRAFYASWVRALRQAFSTPGR
ncbi:alpha/beta hydrolase [Microbacterium sp. RURRCA19A]|uniref:alpha/beta hydrolase n=1 Tax=Microbacterium sp. RURRCA19A TaxID=1907391 RepID=UPI000953FC8E|nr:alpha/beta hydrolase [Microbacterium sp. RURRCA19A]SIS09097.1 Acetyl esterase/lipase [Microbacterium sp. RURRCA19A]